MPLLPAQTKVQLQAFTCKLPVELIADVKAYATAIDSDLSYVVTRALERLTTDKDFQTWKAANLKPETAPFPNSKRAVA
ncbi:MAG: hypothetical protein M3Y57_12035 [Acidobacteriota bacterium]|nr:hypothetical protein [Acidobacteriota bacterium]